MYPVEHMVIVIGIEPNSIWKIIGFKGLIYLLI